MSDFSKYRRSALRALGAAVNRYFILYELDDLLKIIGLVMMAVDIHDQYIVKPANVRHAAGVLQVLPCLIIVDRKAVMGIARSDKHSSLLRQRVGGFT